MTTIHQFSPEITARNDKMIAEGNAALDKLAPLTPGDLIRPFVEWLDFLHNLRVDVVDSVAFPQELDPELHERAEELSRTLARAADLVAMYTEAHIGETGANNVVGLHARSVFETVTGSSNFRRDLIGADEYFDIVAETAK